jgi:hypothetical protein
MAVQRPKSQAALPGFRSAKGAFRSELALMGAAEANATSPPALISHPVRVTATALTSPVLILHVVIPKPRRDIGRSKSAS